MKATQPKPNDLKSMMDAARASHAFKAETAIMEFTEEISRMMEERKISKTQLAQRLGASPAYITKILRGTSNFTLDSMVKIATALGCNYRSHLQREESACDWIDFSREEPVRAGYFSSSQFTPVALEPNRPRKPEPIPAC
jgi:transcriptional regulator with XRE-family HTH domain